MLRIPELSDVPLSERVRRILNDPWFQRLRRVRQLGFTHLVYPGASHTRFEHLIGVFDRATRYLLSLWDNSDVFRDQVRTKDLEATILAALTHDVGHYPFAHVLEELNIFPSTVFKHNELSRAILVNDDSLRALMRENRALFRDYMKDGQITLSQIVEGDWGKDTVQQAASLIAPDGTERWTPVQRVLSQVISGPIDCDKLDYLSRDALHASCPYPRGIDEGRLITSLQMLQTPAKEWVLGIGHKARSSVELLTFNRYMMFTEVYWHHAVRIAMRMFQEAFRRVISRSSADQKRRAYAQLLTCGDDDVLRWLQRAAQKDRGASELLNDLTHRRLYKRVSTVSTLGNQTRLYSDIVRKVGGQPDEIARMERSLVATLRATVSALRNQHILIDVPTPRKGDELEGVFMMNDAGTVVNLMEQDSVLSFFTPRFLQDAKKIRVVAHPQYLSPLQELQELRPRTISSAMRASLSHA